MIKKVTHSKPIRKIRPLFFICSALLIGIVAVALFSFFSKSASASWFDDNWTYRKSIAITTHTAAENNVYINLTGAAALDTSDTTRFQTDCGDLRFTKENGELLPYYIVSGCGSVSTVVHVNFDTFPAGAQTIYFYYGNPSAGNGFNSADFSTEATNYTIGSQGSEEKGPGPIAYWAFDEAQGTTAYDSTVNAANATLTADGTGILTGTTNPAANVTTTTVDFGTGADGACTFNAASTLDLAIGTCSGRGTADMINYVSIINTTASSTSIQINTIQTGIAVGDEILIINLKGTSVNNSNVGQFETRIITSITTTTNANDTLHFATGLTNGYDGTTQKIMVQRIPNYTSVTIGNAGGALTASAWNGTLGGVFFLRATGTVSITGAINMDGKGLLGGTTQVTANNGGIGGEAYNGTGGHGGNAGQAGQSGQGGGGGGNASGALAGGSGTTGPAGGGGGGGNNAAGGGGGGYGGVGLGGHSNAGTHNGSDGSGTTGGNGSGSVLADAGGGGGGGTYGLADLTRLYLGTGGGGGGVNSTGPAGGAGGGIVWVAGATITVNGNIYSRGSNGATSVEVSTAGGGGGAGSGGSIRISGSTLTLGTSKVVAIAGSGGAAGRYCSGGTDKLGNCLGYTTVSGAGGNGGTGRISADKFGNVGGVNPAWKSNDQCVFGKCLYFDGNTSKLTVANAINGVKTISMWVNPNSVSTGPLIDFDGGTHMITFSSGTLSATGFTPTIYVNGKVSTTLAANTWQLVTVVAGTAFNTTSSLTIGRNASSHFQGFMDEVKIYNYARTALQIKSDFVSRGSVKGTSAQMGGADLNYLSNGLKAYYKLDETSGDRTDFSGNGYTLTDNNTVTSGTGKFGNSAFFTRTNTEFLGNSAITFGNADWTVGAWVKLTDKSTYQSIIAKMLYDSTWHYEFEFDYDTVGDRFLITAYRQSDGAIIGTATANNFGSPTAGVWYYVVFWHDSATGQIGIKVNNGLPNTATLTDVLSSTTASFELGRRGTPGFNYYTNGQLDEVRVYNRILSPSEHTSLYNFAPEPVGYWKMDDKLNGNAKTIVDSSGNGNNATSNYGANTTGMGCNQIGKYGGSCLLDGVDDDLRVTDNAVFKPNGAITIESWIYLNNLGTNQNIVTKAYRIDGTWNNPFVSYLLAVDATNVPAFKLTTGGVLGSLGGTTTLVKNTWYHLAGVYDGTNLILYVNGVRDNSTAKTGNIDYNSGTVADLGIGSEGPYTSNEFFNGKLDDVKIYNYARTQNQIVSDMNADHPAVGSPVGSAVAYWDFDEGNSTIANNIGNGGSAINGTLTNMATAPSTATSGWTNAGKFGKGLIFDGTTGNCTGRCDDLINAGSATAVDDLTANPMSLSAWIYPNTLGENSRGIIMAKNVGATPSSGWLWQLSATNTLKFSVDGTTDLVVIAANSKLTMGTWNHVVLSWNGVFTTASSVHMYVNGIEVTYQTQTNGATRTSDAASNLYIGNDSAGTSTFDGTIDEPKIYNYALTASDVKNEYNRGQSLQLGAAGNNSTYQIGAANQEYCIPGDSTSCVAPLGRWDFEENSGQSVYDTSGHGYTGTLGANSSVGADDPSWAVGKIGHGLNFDGSNDFVDFGNLAAVDNLDTFSVSAWFKTKSATTQIIASKMVNYASGAGWVLVMAASGYPALIIQQDGANYKEIDASYTVNLADGKWHHVEATKGPGNATMTMYVDGSSSISISGVFGPGLTTFANSAAFRIGTDANLEYYFNGSLDDLRIFNYVRTPAQIAYDYNKGKPVAYWDFDECQGTQAYDSSENSNTGTITIGTGVGSTQDAVGTCTDGVSTHAWNNGKTGKRNASLNFDGIDDYVSISDPSSGILDFPGTGGWSTSAWIKTSNSGQQIVIGKDSNAAGGRGYNLLTDGGLVVGNFFQSDGNSTIVSSTTPSISDSTWHHIAWTYTYVTSGTSLVNIYVDGKLVKSASNVVGPIQNSVSALTIGERVYVGANGYFNGQIDDPRIYNYALTTTQVKDLYNNGAINYAPATGSP